MADWRARFHATVASDVRTLEGLAWTFTDASSGDVVWTVRREDGGAFPVFSAVRAPGVPPVHSDLEAMTVEAVSALLSAADVADSVGWISRNIAAALLLASCDVLSWEGEEWALESGADDVPVAWASPGDLRVPYAWLRARCRDSERLISVYQDDGVFGLSFLYPVDLRLPASDSGSRRSRTGIDLARGPIRAVDVTYDTTVEGGRCAGLVTEALLHGDTGTTLLIAAEAYSSNEWHLYDESVVALPSLEAADRLEWFPPRMPWRSTSGAPHARDDEARPAPVSRRAADGSPTDVGAQLEVVLRDLMARFGPEILRPGEWGGVVLPHPAGACPVNWLVLGDEIILAVGRGGCRWELASTPEDVAFLRDVVDAALEGRVSEVFGPARSQVTVTLPDGRLVRTAQSRFPRGCLPVPRWRQTTSNRMDYTPYS